MFRKIREILQLFSNRKKRLAFTVPEFCKTNKDLLIIVADPKTDEILVSYREKFAKGKISSADGKELRLVKNVLNVSKFRSSIGDFTVALTESLGLKKISHGAQFFNFIDGALYNIGRANKNKEKTRSMQDRKL